MSNYLDEALKQRGKARCLEAVKKVDYLLGSPSKAFKAVHIAGTNGKGSVATKIAQGLEESGYRVGLYTSPHIYSFCERVQINGTMITEARAERYFEQFISLSSEPLSYFDLCTLLAFAYFADQDVEYGVIETGMGGRLDVTNCLVPLLSVITSIGLDHTTILGDTVEKIAHEKAGIIKEGRPVVVGPNAQPHSLFQAVCKTRKSPCFFVDPVVGDFEAENRAVAKRSLAVLSVNVTQKALSATPPCRFEWWGDRVVFDVAHNPDGFERLFERLQGHRLRVLATFSEAKDIECSLSTIKRYAENIHLAQIDHFMVPKLAGALPVEEAFEAAYSAAMKQQEILVICGSFFLMAEAQAAASKAGLVRSSD